MRATILRVAALAVILAAVLLGQQQLNNEAIMKLHKAGLDDDLIVDMINTRPGHYATGVDDIVALKQAGVSKKVITAILTKSNAAAATPANAGATGATATVPQPSADSDRPVVTQPTISAVYYAKEHQWVLVPVETVNWRIGKGKFKAFASAGLAKREVDGELSGLSSPTSVKAPQFLIFVPHNVSVKQYHLVRLQPRMDGREFMAVREEDFDVKATRDVVPFESKEVRNMWYLIALPRMEPGEYAFVPPEVAQAEHTPDKPGVIYTFHLIE